MTNPRYDTAGRVLESLARQMQAHPPEQPMFLNLNVPNAAPEQIAGVKVTRLGNRSYGESVRQEFGGANGTGQEGQLYRIARNRPIPGQPDADTDIWAVKNNWVSITPLKLGMGDDAALARGRGLSGRTAWCPVSSCDHPPTVRIVYRGALGKAEPRG